MEEAGEKLEAGAGEEEETGLLGGVAVLDFDMLCASVALQTQGGYSLPKLGAADHDDRVAAGEFVGVQRMWEGDVCDCFHDRRIAFQTLCCPCYQFGKNMGRAGTGSCFVQGVIYLLLALFAICSYLSFIFTKQHVFLYLGVAFTFILLTYLGFCRTQIRKQFNIQVTDGSLDDCVYHLACSCCALCQEARTLEINNVQDGYWRGRGDTICVGSKAFAELHQPSLIPIMQTPELCSMEKPSFTEKHSWNVSISQSDPVVPSRYPLNGS